MIAEAPRRSSTKGCRRLADVDEVTRLRLEAGGESRTHVEQMAMNLGALAQTVLPSAVSKDIRLESGGFIQRMRVGGELVWAHYGSELFEVAPGWTSDTCRGWAAFAVPLTKRPLPEQIILAGMFADDVHFAVREWAWLGVRPTVAAEPIKAIRELQHFVSNSSEPRRRFASEVTRPRGVWSKHIPLLKRQPELAFGLLDLLAFDDSRYVATSVGNWLNDVARTRPDFVRESCAIWNARHPVRFARVQRLALRNLKSAAR